MLKLATGKIEKNWKILVLVGIFVHIISLLLLIRHQKNIRNFFAKKKRLADEQVVNDEPSMVQLDQVEEEIKLKPVPFSPLITKWQFSGQLVYKNTRRLALKALVCFVILAGLAALLMIKL